MIDSWSDALLVAAQTMSAGGWRHTLANALSAGHRIDGALVMTCAEGNPREGAVAIWPPRSLPEELCTAASSDARDVFALDAQTLGHWMWSSRGHVLGGLFVRLGDGLSATEVRAPLGDVASVAAHTLEMALDLAASCGARIAHPLPHSLSAREREVAELVSQGFSDLNIAAQLRITEATVGSHLGKIYRKLGVHSRFELARRIGAL